MRPGASRRSLSSSCRHGSSSMRIRALCRSPARRGRRVAVHSFVPVITPVSAQSHLHVPRRNQRQAGTPLLGRLARAFTDRSGCAGTRMMRGADAAAALAAAASSGSCENGQLAPCWQRPLTNDLQTTGGGRGRLPPIAAATSPPAMGASPAAATAEARANASARLVPASSGGSSSSPPPSPSRSLLPPASSPLPPPPLALSPAPRGSPGASAAAAGGSLLPPPRPPSAAGSPRNALASAVRRFASTTAVVGKCMRRSARQRSISAVEFPMAAAPRYLGGMSSTREGGRRGGPVVADACARM